LELLIYKTCKFKREIVQNCAELQRITRNCEELREFAWNYMELCRIKGLAIVRNCKIYLRWKAYLDINEYRLKNLLF